MHITKKNIYYIVENLFPLCTGIYAILTQFYNVNYIIAYFIASIVAAGIYYPLNKWIFAKTQNDFNPPV